MLIFSKNAAFVGTLFLLTLVLSACGGSNSDNGPPPNTKTTANVSNKTASNFSSVSIEEHLTGKVFHSGAFDCAAKQTDCKLYYTGSEITGPAVVFFKDAQGRIVGIYDVNSAPGSYMSPEVTNWTTGAYLYEALANLDPGFKNMSEAERQAVLNVFVSEKDALESANPADSINSLAARTDHYEELALNYLNQQRSGPFSVDAYINALGKRLANREVALAAEFAVPAYVTTASISSLRFALASRFKMLQEMDWISTAHAQTSSSSCTQGMGVFMALFQGATQGIPAAFPIGGIVGRAAGGVGFAVCNTTVVRLNDIIDKLAAVQNSLDNLSDDVGKLTNFVASVQTNANLQDFTNVGTDLSTLAGQYQVILGNDKVGSLKEYVQKVGGSGSDALRNILSKEPDGVFAKLLGRLPATSDQSYLLQIQRLTENQFDSLLSALDLLCRNPSTGDIVKQRAQCNLVIATSTSRLIASQAIAYKLASDTYDLLEAYPTEATRYGYNLSKTATENKAALKAKFDKQAELLVARYNSTVQNADGSKGLYDSYQGLPVALMTSITTANCTSNKNGDPTNVPSILGWVKQAQYEFLITNCKNKDTPVLARYHIKMAGKSVNSNDVGNVMGVLISFANMTNDIGDLGRATYAWGVNTKHWVNLPMQSSSMPNTFAINSVAYSTGALEWTKTISEQPRWVSDELYTGNYSNYSRAWVDKSFADPLPAGFRRIGSSFDINVNRKNYNPYKNLVRYTKSDGYSIVFVLQFPTDSDNRGDAEIWCLSDDCSKTDVPGNRYKQLKFSDGALTMMLNNGWVNINGNDVNKQSGSDVQDIGCR